MKQIERKNTDLTKRESYFNVKKPISKIDLDIRMFMIMFICVGNLLMLPHIDNFKIRLVYLAQAILVYIVIKKEFKKL